MRTPTLLKSLTAAGMLVAASASAAEPVTDRKVLEDLATVITLQGYGCGKARKAEKLRQNDYVVTCRNGDEYRVKIDSNNRVDITKLPS